MECFNASDWIALFALIVSAVSAVFAKLAWEAAEKANEISLHAHRKEVYDAFFDLKMHITTRSKLAELKEVSKFYYSARNAKLYFPKEIADQFQKFFNLCFEVADLARVERTPAELDDAATKCACAIEIANKLESKLIEIIKVT